MGVDARDGLRESDDGVVVVRHAAVSGASVGGEAQPPDALFRGLEQVGPLVTTGGCRHGDGVAAHLADGFGGAVEEFGAVVDGPV